MEEFDLVLVDEAHQPAQLRDVEFLQVEPSRFQPCGFIRRSRFRPEGGLEKGQEQPTVLLECTGKAKDLLFQRAEFQGGIQADRIKYSLEANWRHPRFLDRGRLEQSQSQASF